MVRSWVRKGLKIGWFALPKFLLFTTGVLCALAPQIQAELPVVSLQAVCGSVPENSRATNAFDITRTGSVDESLTVYYRVSGTAVNGRDYERLPGQATIPAGAASVMIGLKPIADGVVEGGKSVVLTLVSNVAPFTLAVLPDSQYYTAGVYGGVPEMFDSQTRWIAEHKDDSNIAFVLHEGDMVDSDFEGQWQLGRRSMSYLDGVVPYAIALGNHDMRPTSAGTQADSFNRFFALTNYENLSSFGGVFESNRMDNTYHLFSAGGVNWMILALEFGPRDAVLAWANDVVTNHPNHRVILLTHAYLYCDNLLIGALPTQYYTPKSYGRQNDGTDVWEKLVRHHQNFAFVICGHIFETGFARLVSTGDWGNNVYQMMADYQCYPYGGGGLMRLIHVDPLQDRFSVETFSPYFGVNKTGPGHQFEYTNAGLANSVKITYAVDGSQARGEVGIDDADAEITSPSVVSVRIEASALGWVRLQYEHMPELEYRLMVSTNLSDWTFVTNLWNSNGVVRYFEGRPEGASRRFFRVVPVESVTILNDEN